MARFDCATWKPVPNHGGPMAAQRGLLLHHAVAVGSLQATFSGDREVSATFLVMRDGTIEQYVDSETVAWHAGSAEANATYCGVETEGCTEPPDYAEPMTGAMVDGLARLYAEGHRRHGWPNALAGQVGEAGFGFHRMASSTACPCDIRLNMRAAVLEKAFGAIPPPPFPPPSNVSHGVPPLHVDYFGPAYGHNYNCADVATWQRQMIARGWAALSASGGADSIFGDTSEQVCRQYQAEKGLAVDGLVGMATWTSCFTAPVT